MHCPVCGTADYYFSDNATAYTCCNGHGFFRPIEFNCSLLGESERKGLKSTVIKLIPKNNMAVTAMLVCQSKEHDTQTPEQGNVHLTGVTDESEEARKYFAFTPYAELRMGILNQSAFGQFELGKTYLITIEEYNQPSA